jgi:hypothetical protein
MTAQGSTPDFLRKSAQPAGRTRDSCDPKNERVRKCLKTRRVECEKLMTRASEQREEEDRGGVQTGLYPSVTSNHNTGIVTLSIVNYVVLCSNG